MFVFRLRHMLNTVNYFHHSCSKLSTFCCHHFMLLPYALLIWMLPGPTSKMTYIVSGWHSTLLTHSLMFPAWVIGLQKLIGNLQCASGFGEIDCCCQYDNMVVIDVSCMWSCMLTGSYGAYGGVEANWRQGYSAGEIINIYSIRLCSQLQCLTFVLLRHGVVQIVHVSES